MTTIPVGEDFRVPEGMALIGSKLYPKKIEPLALAVSKPEDYVLLMKNPTQAVSAISRSELDSRFVDMRSYPTHQAVLNAGLNVVTPREFMPHLLYVNQASKEAHPFYDAQGNLITGKSLQDYANKLNFKSWARLNAFFIKGQGHSGLDVVTITGFTDDGEPMFSKPKPLEKCLETEGYASFDSFNTQGFPRERAPTQNYESGKTIYFYPPVEGYEARFIAFSDGAGLSCDRRIADSDPSLGVFTRAEGAVAENGGNK